VQTESLDILLKFHPLRANAASPYTEMICLSLFTDSLFIIAS